MDRLQQKNNLFIKLGALFGPIQRLIDTPDRYDEQERSEILARYFYEYPKFQEDVFAFTQGQPGHRYINEYFSVASSLDGFQGVTDIQVLAEIVPKKIAQVQAAIAAVPIPRTSVIMDAGSPFTTYCKIKELCEVDATESLLWLDPFFGASIFYRYIYSVRQTIPVTLVTSEPGLHHNKKDMTRWNEFMDVSRLYAKEHGPSLYRLVVQPNLHDRWVIFDHKRIYALGGSAKDAGDKDYFTIASVDASRENLSKIKSLVDTGTEFFGSSNPSHN